MQAGALEWIKTIGSLLFSWPMVGLITVVIFRKPLLQILQQFTNADLRKVKAGPIEIERDLKELATQGQQAVANLNRISELMAESRLLELEIFHQSIGGILLTDEQRQKMQSQIEELRKLTQKG
ncbi:MAG: hypothetical protein AB1791_14625 [Chloroflexota bacterium]